LLLFLFIIAATQLTLQLHQERVRMVRSDGMFHRGAVERLVADAPALRLGLPQLYPNFDPNFGQRRRQLLVEVRRGARTCAAPCILGRVSDSAFMQARMRLQLQ